MKYLLAVLKISVTFLLVLWLTSQTDISKVKEILKYARYDHIVLAVVLHILAYTFSGLRWWILLGHTHAHVRFAQIFPGYYLGTFLNNLLPTSFGGDLIRILYLRKHGISSTNLISSTIADRAVGLFTCLILGAAGLVTTTVVRHDALDQIPMITIMVVFGVLALLVAAPMVERSIGRVSHRFRSSRLLTKALEVLRQCLSYRKPSSRLVAAFAIALILQTIVIGIYWMLGIGLGIEIPLSAYFVIVPVVFVAASLPISLGGLGVREGALVALFVASGADSTAAVGLAVLYLVVMWAASFPGALVLLVRGNRHAVLRRNRAT